jgi:hypothetical protein
MHHFYRVTIYRDDAELPLCHLFKNPGHVKEFINNLKYDTLNDIKIEAGSGNFFYDAFNEFRRDIITSMKSYYQSSNYR